MFATCGLFFTVVLGRIVGTFLVLDFAFLLLKHLGLIFCIRPRPPSLSMFGGCVDYGCITRGSFVARWCSQSFAAFVAGCHFVFVLMFRTAVFSVQARLPFFVRHVGRAYGHEPP